MYSAKNIFQEELAGIQEAGLFKKERVIVSPQGAQVKTQAGQEVIIMCANNYLGLSSHPQVIEAAKNALDTHGYGMSSVRFICGTQDLHKQLEQRLSAFLGTEDTILYAACFDANGGVFEPLLGEQDAIISDALNHASIIDGVRLCKAVRYRYSHSNMQELEETLQKAQAQRMRLIVTDGVFSMDGDIAKLPEICALAQKYQAMLMVDDSHATGFIGKTGRGTAEYHGVQNQIDIYTGTLGKALGGAMGGYTSGKKEIIEMLRQRSRPYLFSNSLSPVIAGASLKVLDLLESSTTLRDTLEKNTLHFKKGIQSLGFDVKKGESPIIPVMLYDAPLAQKFAEKLLEEGVYAIGFFYPVVPKGEARIRVQISAGHSIDQLDKALAAFEKVGKELDVIK